MKPPTPLILSLSKETQLATFAAGVALFGSVEHAARRMAINVRTLRYLLNARRALHDGHCRALAAALVALAAEARALEKRISPAFAANLTEKQQTAAPHGNRFDRRKQPHG